MNSDISSIYSKSEIKNIKRQWLKAENMMNTAELAISDLTQYVENHFTQNVTVIHSTDGAMIIDEKGEIMPFSYFFGFHKNNK